MNARNVQALHSLTHRANSLSDGLTITLNLSAATVESAVLDALQAYASLQRLPRYIDPEQAECNLRILAGEPVQRTRLEKTLVQAR